MLTAVSRALTEEIKRVTGERQRKAAVDSLRFVRSASMCTTCGPLMVARARLIRGRRRQRRRNEEDRRHSIQHIWYFCADYTSTRRYIDEARWTTDRRSPRIPTNSRICEMRNLLTEHWMFWRESIIRNQLRENSKYTKIILICKKMLIKFAETWTILFLNAKIFINSAIIESYR